MAKQRQNQSRTQNRPNIYQQRIQQKLRLLEFYPDAIVYEFRNPTIRENFRVPLRIVELANNAFREFWGFYVDDEDVAKIDAFVKEIEEKAKDVIELGEKLGKGLVEPIDFDRLKRMRKIEKERLIKNSRVTTELIIPQNKAFDIIYEAVLYVDRYDLPIKQHASMEEAKEWIKAVKEFMDVIKKAESEIIKLTAEKINPRYLGRYKALRNNVVRYLKATEDAEETPATDETTNNEVAAENVAPTTPNTEA